MLVKLISFLICYCVFGMDQELITFLNVPNNSDFTIHNIPFGTCSIENGPTFAATIIGDTVISLTQLEKLGLLEGPLFKGKDTFQTNLNGFLQLSRPYWLEVRHAIQKLFQCGSKLETDKELFQQVCTNVEKVQYHLPCTVGEYTDFYSSKNHAFNLGSILRGPGNELQPNWLYLPVGYHGRRSSIVITGNDLRRPWGQVKAPTAENPSFTASKRLDFELEVGAIIGGVSNKIGDPIRVDSAEDRIFGFVLLNDWSARDIQGWEYVPLGPFTAKNLMTTISPWIVTVDALQPYRVPLEKQEPQPFSYLAEKIHSSFDINLEVHLSTAKQPEADHILTSNFKYLYWSVAQQLAHHSITGCNMNPGDILGSGTISGLTREERGCLMEYTWNGKEPLKLKGGEARTFLEDGDTVEFRGFSGLNKNRVGFGSCRGTITPALPEQTFQN